MVVLVLLHWYWVLLKADPVKVTGKAERLLQIAWLPSAFTLGTALTVIEKAMGVPEQAFEIGTTVINPEMGTLEALVEVKVFMVPDPETARPMAELVLLHW